ncbi:MAG TPA: DapH/DapD/GlmU-related protein [Myxococcota bacterium]|nr:DapH/DapD/GlmU-related protein [Myxococcota bacterium]
MTARERWRADVDRYVEASGDPDAFLRRFRIILFTEGVWALSLYRFGQYLHEEAPSALRAVLRVPYLFARKLLVMMIGIHLGPETQVGPGLFIAHYGGIWINPRVRMGAHCNIAHGVTIGAPDAEAGAPVLGDRVWIGAGAVVTGPVQIGSGAVIGANSLVSSNLPENAVAVGVPARVLAYTGSERLMSRGAESRAQRPA